MNLESRKTVMGLISEAESQPASSSVSRQWSVIPLDQAEPCPAGTRKGPGEAGPEDGQGLGVPYILGMYSAPDT